MAIEHHNMRYPCAHLAETGEVTPGANGCEECLQLGDQWVHLRLCTTCGHVGCCDNSKNRHATSHFHATRHPIIKSFEPGEDWGYCYEDDTYVEQLPANAGKHYQRRPGR
jgi:monovalent cation:H+ antiporter-2, CPA2 family